MSWPHDDTASLIAFYGDPAGANWQTKNLVRVSVPWKMVLAWDTAHSLTSFLCHAKCKDAFAAALQTIWSRCGNDQSVIEDHGLHLYGGCFNYRPIRGSTRLSTHAFGAAIDINPDGNALGAQWNPAHMPQFVIDAFKTEGAFWGGDFIHRKDCQHFQFATEGG